MSSDRYLRKIRVQGDRLVLVAVWLMCFNSLALANWYKDLANRSIRLGSSRAAIDRSDFRDRITFHAPDEWDGLHVSCRGCHTPGTWDD